MPKENKALGQAEGCLGHAKIRTDRVFSPGDKCCVKPRELEVTIFTLLGEFLEYTQNPANCREGESPT